MKVAWGDGSSETVEAASSPLTLDHTYAAAGAYTATVTVTDGHEDGHEYSTTAEVAVAYTTNGLLAPFKGDSVTAKSGSTVPVKVEFLDCDGSEPTDLAPTVTMTGPGGATVRTGTMAYVNGSWLFEVRTKGLSPGTYTVTITVPETGQTVVGSIVLRR